LFLVMALSMRAGGFVRAGRLYPCALVSFAHAPDGFVYAGEHSSPPSHQTKTLTF
jgi:hypothetical protein